MGSKVTARTITRKVEVCPFCGAWDSFRKGRGGKSVVDPRTGLRRIYGECRICGGMIIVQYAAPEDS